MTEDERLTRRPAGLSDQEWASLQTIGPRNRHERRALRAAIRRLDK